MAVTTKSQLFIIIIWPIHCFVISVQTMPLSDLTEFLGLSLPTRILMSTIVTHRHFCSFFGPFWNCPFFSSLNYITACWWTKLVENDNGGFTLHDKFVALLHAKSLFCKYIPYNLTQRRLMWRKILIWNKM